MMMTIIMMTIIMIRAIMTIIIMMRIIMIRVLIAVMMKTSLKRMILNVSLQVRSELKILWIIPIFILNFAIVECTMLLII